MMDASQITRASRMHWFLFALADATAAIITILYYRSGEIPTPVLAFIVVAVVVSVMNFIFLRAFLQWRRAHGVMSRNLTLFSSCLALLAIAITTTVAASTPQHNDYLRLALSDTPLASIDPPTTRLVVQLIRAKAANSRENDKLLADVQAHPLNLPLYSPASFSSQQAMTSTVTRFSEIVALDHDYVAKQQAATQQFRAQMATVDPEYLEKWNASMRKGEDDDANAEALQERWLSSVRHLYAFAASHSVTPTVPDSKVHFHSDVESNQFDELLKQSQSIQAEFLLAEQSRVAAQKKIKNKSVR